MRRYAPHVHMPSHVHDFDKVSMVLSGAVRERHGAVERVSEAGWMVVKPAEARHEDWVGPNGLCTLTFSIGPTADCTEVWKRLVHDYRWLPVGRDVRRLLRLAIGGVEHVDGVLNEVALSLASQVFAHSAVNDDWFSKADECLRSSYVSPPTLVELAEEVAVHPVTLSRAFRDRGTSKSEVVHMERVRQAMRLLSSGQPLAAIAAELGYADAAHFSRSFRLFVGVAPSEFRSWTSARS